MTHSPGLVCVHRLRGVPSVVAALISLTVVLNSAVAEDDERVIGGPGPTIVDAADPHGEWVVMCQAREDTDENGRLECTVGQHGKLGGDRMRTYVVFRDGAELTVDMYVGRSRTALTAIHDGKLAVIDVESRRVSRIDTGDLVGSALMDFARRAVSLDASGELLLYPSIVDGQERLNLLAMRLKTDRQLAFPAGSIESAWLTKDGEVAIARIATEDTDGNGRIEAQRDISNVPGDACRAPWISMSSVRGSGDRGAYWVGPTRASKYDPSPNIIGGMGGSLIISTPGGELILDEAAGQRSIVPASQRPAVVFISSKYRTLLIETDGPAGRMLRLFGRGEPRVVVDEGLRRPVSLAREAVFQWVYVDVASGKRVFIDMDTGQHQEVREEACAWWESHLLLCGSGGAHVLDLRTGRTVAVPGVGTPDGPVLMTAGWVASGGALFSLSNPERVRRYHAAAAAVSDAGRVLVGVKVDGEPRLVRGPLRWTDGN